MAKRKVGVLSVVLIVALLCSILSVSFTSAAKTSDNYVVNDDEGVNMSLSGEILGLLGDADLDSKINVKDATAIQKNVASLIAFEETQLILADVDQSGGVNVKDATAIQKWVAGITVDMKINHLVYIPQEDTTVPSQIATVVSTESTVSEMVTTTPSEPTQPTEPITTVPEEKCFIVVFVDYDGTELKKQIVNKGEGAVAPEVLDRAGYVFIGWDIDFEEVHSDLTVKAQYRDNGLPAVEVERVVSTASDETVRVPVQIRNNPGIVGMTLSLDYDESALSLTSIVKGSALSEMTFTIPKALNSGCNLPWDAEFVEPENVTNGEILVLTFKVLDNAQKGIYDISLRYDDGAIVNNDLLSVDMLIIDGAIFVK